MRPGDRSAERAFPSSYFLGFAAGRGAGCAGRCSPAEAAAYVIGDRCIRGIALRSSLFNGPRSTVNYIKLYQIILEETIDFFSEQWLIWFETMRKNLRRQEQSHF